VIPEAVPAERLGGASGQGLKKSGQRAGREVTCSTGATVYHCTMEIKLSYVGWLKLEGVKSGSTVQVQDGSTIRQVMSRYKIPDNQQKFITPFVNNEERDPGYVLRDQDELSLQFNPGGGG